MAAGAAVDQLALTFATQPVVFLEHDIDHADPVRYSRWWSAYGGGGSVSLPLVMVGSGHAFSSGPLDYATAYGQFVSVELGRPPKAQLQATSWRVGNRVRVVGTLTNASGVTLSHASNGASVQVLAYEEAHVGVTGRFVRAAALQPIASALANGSTMSFALETADLGGADWSRVHVVVFADYRPGGSTGAFDMLQAARLRLGNPNVTLRDFDGDLKTDATVFRPSTGVWYQLRSGAANAAGIVWGATTDIPVPADYDGDGTADVAVFRPATGAWYIVKSTTSAAVGVPWGQADDVPVPADYDGDGKADVAVFRPSAGTWYIVESATSAAVGIPWGQVGDAPVPADYDGDAQADVAVFRPSTGTWYIVYSATNTPVSVPWGQLGDVPIAADYDGDGKADPTLFRPATGAWYQWRSATGAAFGFSWGQLGDAPVVGDYDGDGKADPTVFRPATGGWYQLRSTTGAHGFVWGVPGDLPQ